MLINTLLCVLTPYVGKGIRVVKGDFEGDIKFEGAEGALSYAMVGDIKFEGAEGALSYAMVGDIKFEGAEGALSYAMVSHSDMTSA